MHIKYVANESLKETTNIFISKFKARILLVLHSLKLLTIIYSFN